MINVRADQISVGHVGRVGAALSKLLPQLDAARSAQINTDGPPYVSGSQADLDSEPLAFASHVMDLLGGVGMSYGAALDSASAVADIALAAAEGAETSVYAHHSIARSVVELLAQNHWLTDPALSSETRLARSLSVRRRDAFGAISRTPCRKTRTRSSRWR